MIEVFFDDESVAVPRLTTEEQASRRPNAWTESQSTSGWSASFRNDVRTEATTVPLLLGLVLVAGVLAKLVASGLGWVSAVAFAAGMVAVGMRGKAILEWFAARRTSTFSMSEGFLRIRSGRTVPFEVRLADVEHCFAEEAQPTDLLVNGAFRLVVRVRDGLPLRLPLHVPTAAEAQFVSERINAMLETDGKAMNVGYRGELLRVAPPEAWAPTASPTRVATAEPDEEGEEHDASRRELQARVPR